MRNNIFKKMTISISLIAAILFSVMGLVIIHKAPDKAAIVATYRASHKCEDGVPISEKCFYITPSKVLAIGTTVDAKHFSHLMIYFENLNNHSHFSVEFLHTPLYDQVKLGQILYVKTWQGSVTAAFDNANILKSKNLITGANPQVWENLELDGGLALIAFGVILVLLIIPLKPRTKAVAYL